MAKYSRSPNKEKTFMLSHFCAVLRSSMTWIRCVRLAKRRWKNYFPISNRKHFLIMLIWGAHHHSRLFWIRRLALVMMWVSLQHVWMNLGSGINPDVEKPFASTYLHETDCGACGQAIWTVFPLETAEVWGWAKTREIAYTIQISLGAFYVSPPTTPPMVTLERFLVQQIYMINLSDLFLVTSLFWFPLSRQPLPEIWFRMSHNNKKRSESII